MPLSSDDLERIAAITLRHYDQRAEEFWEGTRDHDVAQNIAALLQFIDAAPPFAILDFGCGPGRDLQAFKRLGHLVTGLEGSAKFAAMARALSGCEVLQQNFLKLDLPAGHFDGVFANAALFHVPSEELPRVLRELHTTLKPGGALFCSNPRGDDQEGWMATVTVLSTVWMPGAGTCRRQTSSNSPTSIVQQAGPWNSNRGWRLCGASRPAEQRDLRSLRGVECRQVAVRGVRHHRHSPGCVLVPRYAPIGFHTDSNWIT